MDGGLLVLQKQYPIQKLRFQGSRKIRQEGETKNRKTQVELTSKPALKFLRVNFLYARGNP